jgi:hypothetical protein
MTDYNEKRQGLNRAKIGRLVQELAEARAEREKQEEDEDTHYWAWWEDELCAALELRDLGIQVPDYEGYEWKDVNVKPIKR